MRPFRHLTSDTARECAFVACLIGLAVFEFGWIVWPPIGRLTAIVNAAFVVVLLLVRLIRRLAKHRLVLTFILSIYD